MKTMPAGKFKAQCLSVIDDVHDLKEEVVITKHGKPMAKLVPVRKKTESLFGAMRGQIEILGDLVAPITEPHEWSDSIFPEEDVSDPSRSKRSLRAAGKTKSTSDR